MSDDPFAGLPRGATGMDVLGQSDGQIRAGARSRSVSAASSRERRVATALIKQVVAREFGISLSAMLGPSRWQLYVVPRHVAMYLAREVNGDSFPRIGRDFSREHSSVQHACDSTRKLMKNHPEFRERVERLRDSLPLSLPTRQRILAQVDDPAVKKLLVMRWWETNQIAPDDAAALIRLNELEGA